MHDLVCGSILQQGLQMMNPGMYYQSYMSPLNINNHRVWVRVRVQQESDHLENKKAPVIDFFVEEEEEEEKRTILVLSLPNVCSNIIHIYTYTYTYTYRHKHLPIHPMNLLCQSYSYHLCRIFPLH